MVQLNFAANQFQARYGSDGGGLPPGKHKVIIEKTEIVPTKDSNITGNAYLQITMKCIDGLGQGGFQTDRLNLHNSNQQTVAIAQSQLAAYCMVIGKQGFQDTSELHNIPFYVEVRNQRGNPDFTEVAKLYDLNGNEPGKGQQPQVQSHPQAGPPIGFQGAANGPTAWGAPQAAQVMQQPQQQQQGWQQPQPESQPQPQVQPQQQWQPQGGGQAPPWGSQGGNQNAPGWTQR